MLILSDTFPMIQKYEEIKRRTMVSGARLFRHSLVTF